MRRSLAVLIALAATGTPGAPAVAASLPGPIEAAVERVIDGDTFQARALIWLDQEIIIAVRLADIDTPELSRPSCPAEEARARAARDFTEAFLGGRAVLTDIRHDKYAGRVLAHVRNASGEDLGEALVGAGLGARAVNAAWCPIS